MPPSSGAALRSRDRSRRSAACRARVEPTSADVSAPAELERARSRTTPAITTAPVSGPRVQRAGLAAFPVIVLTLSPSWYAGCVRSTKLLSPPAGRGGDDPAAVSGSGEGVGRRCADRDHPGRSLAGQQR